MQTVTVRRECDADVDAVRAAMSDVEPFIRAAGFDSVAVDGDEITVRKEFGVTDVELRLERFDDPDTDLAYRQRAGMFEEMVTTYTIFDREDGSEIIAETEFSLDVAVVGELLDATFIKFQRRRELNAQFDWIEDRVAH